MDSWSAWQEKVRLEVHATPPSLFERKWTYVESVTGDGDTLTISFNVDTEKPGPFNVKFFFRQDKGTWTGQWTKTDLNKPWQLLMKDATKKGDGGILELRLDDIVAYNAYVSLNDIPF